MEIFLSGWWMTQSSDCYNLVWGWIQKYVTWTSPQWAIWILATRTHIGIWDPWYVCLRLLWSPLSAQSCVWVSHSITLHDVTIEVCGDNSWNRLVTSLRPSSHHYSHCLFLWSGFWLWMYFLILTLICFLHGHQVLEHYWWEESRCKGAALAWAHLGLGLSWYLRSANMMAVLWI
jgi:hypothetical protein